MNSLYKILIVLHVAGGTAGLISGTVATAVIKGRKTHLLTGKIFFYSMLLASLSAAVISHLPGHKNVFLFAISGFTIYMITSGYRMIFLKRRMKAGPVAFGGIDYAISLFAVAFGTYLLYQSFTFYKSNNMFFIVPGVFGLICLLFFFLDYRLYSGKRELKYKWMSNHITRMIGALIASYTAFLVVNVQIDMQWILWILPTAVGSILIVRFLKKYAPRVQHKPSV